MLFSSWISFGPVRLEISGFDCQISYGREYIRDLSNINCITELMKIKLQFEGQPQIAANECLFRLSTGLTSRWLEE